MSVLQCFLANIYALTQKEVLSAIAIMDMLYSTELTA